MAVFAKVFSATTTSRCGCLMSVRYGRSLSHSTTTPCNTSSVSNPLLVRLLREPNSGIKTALEDSSIVKPDVFFWESLVTALASSSSPDKAQLVLEWKLEKLMKENERDQSKFSELIVLGGKIQNISFSLEVFNLMEAHGLRPTAAIFNSLISVCLYSDNLTTSLSLFEIMNRTEDCKPNLTTYNALISHYSKLGDAKSMQLWYSASKMAGFTPNIRTYESLIAGCIKSKELDSANTFYEEMTLSGVTPSAYIMEKMIEGLCQQKKLVKVKQFLQFMLDGGWNLSGQMVETLLQLYSRIGSVEETEELLKVLVSSNQNLEVLSLMHRRIIRMYALLDRLDDMEFSVGRMLKQGISFTCPDDVEKVISSYFRRSAYDRLDLFLERISESYKLSQSTYDLLISGYERAGMQEKLDSLKELRLD